MSASTSLFRIPCISIIFISSFSQANPQLQQTTAPPQTAPVTALNHDITFSPMAAATVETYWTPERLEHAQPLPLPQATSRDAHSYYDVNNHSLPPQIIESTTPTDRVNVANNLLKPVVANSEGLQWQDANSQVARVNGKLWFTKPNGGIWVCSASVVSSAGRSLIVTAAHCVRDQKGYFSHFLFAPGYRGPDAPYGKWTAKEIRASNSDGNTTSNDVAFIVLNTNSEGRKIQDVTGSSGLYFNIPAKAAGRQIFRFGYPANRYDGQQLSYCYVSGSYVPGWLKHSCNMTGGSSGGPVVTDFLHKSRSYGYAFGVASVTYGGNPATTGQTSFGDTEWRLYNDVGKLAPEAFQEMGYIKLRHAFKNDARWTIYNPASGYYPYGSGKQLKISDILAPHPDKKYLQKGNVIYVYAETTAINADYTEGKRLMTNKIELKIR